MAAQRQAVGGASIDAAADGLIYLASPYSSPSTLVREQRHTIAEWATAQLVRAGYLVFGPIVHSHDMAKSHGMPGEWAFWWSYDQRMIDKCDTMYVLCIDGWVSSTGVQAEIQHAITRGMLIRYVSIEELERLSA